MPKASLRSAVNCFIGIWLLWVTPAEAQKQYATPALAQETTATLPHGATSLQETYGAWIVGCRIIERQKICTLAQSHGNRRTGQRNFAIELRPPADGKTQGVLLLPFALALGAGARLAIDDKALGQAVPFSTCVSSGCLVPISFPTSVTEAIKTAKTLKVIAMPSGGAEPMVFPFVLEGFATALKRIAALVN